MSNLNKKFGQIYDKYIDKIYRFIFFKVSSPEITEDLCSETFLKGWEAFKNQKPDERIKNPPAFLYQIARNLIIDFYRKRDRSQVISTENTRIIDPRLNLEERAFQDSEFNQIKHALFNIKDDYQEVIIWHYLDDLPVSEIAKLLNKSEEAVRVMLHRALKALKRELNLV